MKSTQILSAILVTVGLVRWGGCSSACDMNASDSSSGGGDY
ncbi:hypothetical protein [Trinickia violacea]|nr:hypothetical protein [Trinickia violacea]